MEQSKQEAMAAGLKRLMESARPELMRRLRVVEKAVEALHVHSLTEELRKPAHAEAHKLAGVLGTYGFKAASHSAHELEVLFEKTCPTETKQMMVHIKIVKTAIEDK